MTATATAAVAFALVAVLDWSAVYRQSARLERVAKPLVMVALGWLALTMGAADDQVGRLVLVAVALSLVGDVFLLSKATVAFPGGLVAFLLAHLAYVLAFLVLGFEPWWALIGLVVVVVLSLTSGRRIVRAAGHEGGAALGAGVAAYLLVISAMVVTASGTARPLVLLGALAFLLSDTVLALDRFAGQRAHARMVVIVTYHVGQVLMVIGALR
ncbi:MAG TPA: lysoplasmalogenase [Dermatophilaceae bacterium]|jgi:uncharacterized membrane protein YhhN